MADTKMMGKIGHGATQMVSAGRSPKNKRPSGKVKTGNDLRGGKGK